MDTIDAILPGIEHFVVVMFENRSFDNLLGGLYPEKTRQGLYHGVAPGLYNKVDPYTPNLGVIKVWQDQAGLDAMIMPYPDPGELFADMNVQLFAPNPPPASGPGNPTMGGFVYNYAHQPVQSGGPVPRGGDIMQYYKPGRDGNLPIMTTLAQAYGVSDAWFASGPVQTLVNRIFVHSGQPSTYIGKNGLLYNCVDNPSVTNQAYDPLGNVYVPTVFEQMDKKFGSGQVNWKVYYNDFPLSALINYVYNRWGEFQQNVTDYSYFASDVRANNLPRYSFIEPRYTNMRWDGFCQSAASYMPSSYHPGGACPGWGPNDPDTPPPVSVCFGEQFLANIYSSLAANPDVFKKTLLIVTFDEHGGLYDHVAPPGAKVPNNGVVNFKYDRYGVRVPALFINPYIKPGSIFRSTGTYPYDHTSIISTLRHRFSLGGPFTERDKWAPTFDGVINSSTLNPFGPADLPPLSCQIPPMSPRGVMPPTGDDPNSIYSVILRGMKSAVEKGLIVP